MENPSFALTVRPEMPRVKAAGKLLQISMIAVLLVTVVAAQQNAPPQTSPAQLPDAPSATQPSQRKSFGQTMGTIVKTIGEYEWTMMKAPFQTQGLGFDTGRPFRHQKICW